MSNTYNHKTLNGNWNEERAQPLKGVMVDYGYREYGSTQKEAFAPKVDAYGATRAAVMKARARDVSFAITQAETCGEAQRLAVPPEDGFLTRRPAPALATPASAAAPAASGCCHLRPLLVPDFSYRPGTRSSGQLARSSGQLRRVRQRRLVEKLREHFDTTLQVTTKLASPEEHQACA